MNASSLKVLQEVLTGFIIKEPYVRRSGVKGRRRRYLGTKSVLRQSGFPFWCHRATNRERERERERNRKVPTHLISLR